MVGVAISREGREALARGAPSARDDLDVSKGSCARARRRATGREASRRRDDGTVRSPRDVRYLRDDEPLQHVAEEPVAELVPEDRDDLVRLDLLEQRVEEHDALVLAEAVHVRVRVARPLRAVDHEQRDQRVLDRARELLDRLETASTPARDGASCVRGGALCARDGARCKNRRAPTPNEAARVTRRRR